MKLLKLSLFALALLLLASLTLAAGALHASPGAPSIALAMEPASWVLVAMGLVGGGFLHKRRLPGLDLVSSTAPTPVSPAKPTSARRSWTRALTSRTFTTRTLTLPTFLPAKLWAGAAAALLLLLVAPNASADSFTLSAAAVATDPLSPSADSISLNAASETVTSTAQPFTLQTGSFIVGNTTVADQVVPLSFLDTITLNGITHTLTIYGHDAVTTTADTLTLSANPVTFGNEVLGLQTFSLTEASMGTFTIDLDATLAPAPTPEPASLLLLGTGIIAGALLLARRSAAQS